MYITQSDLEAAIPEQEFLELTDRVNDPPATPDSTIIDAAIESAAGRLHMYMMRRYKLPLDMTDTILAGFVRRILVDYAWLAMFPSADMAPNQLVTRCSDHDETLKEIRDGDADLPAGTPPAADSDESKISASSEGRRFGGLP